MTQKRNQRDSQGRKQGYWEETNPSGYTYKGHYKDNLQEGVWEKYHSDGTISSRYNYHHGKLHGHCEEYRSDGTLRWRGHYHHDRPHGVWEAYHPDGTPDWRHHYHHGKLHGHCEEYRSDGTLRWRRHYHNGELISEDSDETIHAYNTIIFHIGFPTWLSIPPDCLLFLHYTDLL